MEGLGVGEGNNGQVGDWKEASVGTKGGRQVEGGGGGHKKVTWALLDDPRRNGEGTAAERQVKASII